MLSLRQSSILISSVQTSKKSFRIKIISHNLKLIFPKGPMSLPHALSSLPYTKHASLSLIETLAHSSRIAA